MGWFSSVVKTVKKGAEWVKDTAIGIGKHIGGWFKGGLNRLAGFFDYLGCLLEIRFEKNLRLQVYILSDCGCSVQSIERVQELVDMTIYIYDSQANIRIKKADSEINMIKVMEEDAPSYALYPPNRGWDSSLSLAADWFKAQAKMPNSPSSFLGKVLDWIGWGDPFFIFVVDDIQNNKPGTMYMFGQNFAIISKDAKLTVMAHEIAHGLGIAKHSKAANNLMTPNRDQDSAFNLRKRQVCWIRNSRFVTYRG